MGVCHSRKPHQLNAFDRINVQDTHSQQHLSTLTNADSTHVNILLNSLLNNEVEMLIQIFSYHCRHYIDSNTVRTYNPILYNVNSLKVLFPSLQAEIFTDRYIQNIFNAFDNASKAYIDLRDFCRVYVIAMRGSQGEMIELLFSIFYDMSSRSSLDTDRLTTSDSSLVGRKASNIRQTHPTATDTDRKKEGR
jgi:hypothetical protein